MAYERVNGTEFSACPRPKGSASRGAATTSLPTGPDVYNEVVLELLASRSG